MNKRKSITFLVMALIILSLILGYNLYEKNREYRVSTQNSYNMAFYELVDYVQNVKTYLAKSLITTDDKHGAETLTHVWREANLAQTYLAMIPLEIQELENTEKFLNQVSEYSYSLSRKNIDNIDLKEEDLDNLKELYSYSVELSNVLNQLSDDVTSGRITWEELKDDGNAILAQQVSNVSQDSFGALEENFHEYAGLIYDGAFSEHLTGAEKKGIKGEEISKDTARQKVEEFVGKDRIKQIISLELENSDIEAYTFGIETNKNENIGISVSKIGGIIIYMNCDRNIETQIISDEEAKNKAKEFLDRKGFSNMKETYHIKQGGISTINFAYEQPYDNNQNVIMYADLIKVKVALDNGEILGIETTGYLNNHYERELSNPNISIEEAKAKLNTDIELTNQRLAMIPTEWNTEIFCYEFQGRIDDIEFLTYINVETGEEEDTLIITNTENGILTE